MEREACWRQFKALKKVQREAKRKLVAQLEISHEAAVAILSGQRNLETVHRHSEALKKAQRDAKRKLIAQPEISHEAAELVQRTRQLEQTKNFMVSYTSATSSLCYTDTRTCFLHTKRCCQRWWITEATEVSVRRLWRISPADFEELVWLVGCILENWMQKEILITQKGELVFPVADGSAKITGRDYVFRKPTLRREPTVRSEYLSGGLQGEPDDRADFWSIQSDLIYRL